MVIVNILLALVPLVPQGLDVGVDLRRASPPLGPDAIQDGNRVRCYRLIPNLRRYQIVQKEIDRIVVKLQLVPASPPMTELLETMTRSMARDLGDGIRLQVEMVNDIPCEPSGKFRTFRCLVSRDQRR